MGSSYWGQLFVTVNPKATPAQRQKAIEGLIRDLSADGRPILVGPWRSEVGFECLYWLPFLRFLASKVPKFKERAVAVTRGGLAPLYNDVAKAGPDTFNLRSVVEWRRENAFDAKVRQKGKTIKQLEITEWDTALLADVAAQMKLGALYHVVHPSVMYWALGPFWDEHAGMRYLQSMADYTPLPKIQLTEAQLPPQYVAMKWYARPTFPYPHEAIGPFVQHTVATVASKVPVVLLNSPNDFDDHVDIPISGPNVHLLPPNLKPEENLKVQAAILAGAKAFVGTYGGVAQLALRVGIPAVSFYLEFGGTCHAHLALSSWLSKATRVQFCVGSLEDASAWTQILTVTMQQAQQAPEPAVA